MTPSMGMAAPKGTQAPAAGLAAIAQPAQAPKGMTSGSMAQVMAMARKMSDAQLAEVLQGKSLDVPQYVAMTEAMGRKSLRTAMDGQQAMAQAKQPSVKEKLLMGDQPQMPQGMPQMPQQPVMAAEGGMMYADGGIAELPAPNMESMDMASGGIVAFQNNENQPVREGMPSFAEGSETDKKILEFLKNAPGAVVEKFKELNQPRGTTFAGTQAELDDMVQRGRMPKRDAMRDAVAAAPKITTDQRMQQDMENAAPGTVLTTPPAPAAKPPLTPKLPPVVTPGGPAADKEKAGLGATDEFASFMDAIKKNNTDYLSELKGASAKQREGLAKVKSQGGGEALMAISKGLLSKGTLAQGVAEGLPGVMAASAGSRKEQIAGENAANEMDFNLAKARQAAAKGDMESALMFKRLADEASYRKDSIGIQRAQLNKPDSNIALLNALGDPKLMERYKEMQASKKGELYSLDKATDDFNKIAGDKFSDQAKRLKALGITTPYQYQQYVLNQGGGGGFDLSAAARAELERRSKS